MRRAYLSALLAVVLPIFSVYAQGMRGGHSRGLERHGSSFSSHHSFGGQSHSFRGGSGGNHFGGRSHEFHHGFFHGHGSRVVFFGYGYGIPYCPCPSYCRYPYNYPDPGYYDTGPAYSDVTYSDTYVPPVETSGDRAAPDNYYTNQDAQSYYQLGYQWGGELRQYHGTTDQLAAHPKVYIVNASSAQRDAFRSGFIASAAANAETTYDQAMQQASHQG